MGSFSVVVLPQKYSCLLRFKKVKIACRIVFLLVCCVLMALYLVADERAVWIFRYLALGVPGVATKEVICYV